MEKLQKVWMRIASYDRRRMYAEVLAERRAATRRVEEKAEASLYANREALAFREELWTSL